MVDYADDDEEQFDNNYSSQKELNQEAYTKRNNNYILANELEPNYQTS